MSEDNYIFDFLSSENDATTINANFQKIDAGISEVLSSRLQQIFETGVFSISISSLNSIFDNCEAIESKLEMISEYINKMFVLRDYPRKPLNIIILIDDSIVELPKKIEPEYVNNLVYFEGTVCKISPPKPKMCNFVFECSVCKLRKNILNEDDRYKLPEPYCKCKKYVFKLNEKENMLRDFQELRIKLKESEDYVTCEIWDEKVNILMPGENIRGIGVVKLTNENKGYFMTYLDVKNFIIDDNVKIKENDMIIPDINNQENEKTICLSENDIFESVNNSGSHKIFIEMSKEKDIFSYIMNTIFDDIYGHEEIKAGLLLALVTGSIKNKRSGLNILMIGDPGLGKSKLLLKTGEIIPKSIYICGNNTTTAGLTISLSNDPSTGDYAVDSGALVMADNGVCLIDEFDKIPDLRALNEVMEVGNLCYNKGGVYYTLKVNTSIIGATNPKNGHFDKKKSLKENVKFDSALLSRFDLIFVMTDEFDIRKIKNIMKIKDKPENLENSNINREEIAQKIISMSRKNDMLLNLCKKSDKYNMDTIKKYISFCRKNINPVLSIKAKLVIKEYYLNIRKRDNVNIRTLESLIRITEAYAKIHLKGIASEKDAEFAIGLHKLSSIGKKVLKKKKITEVLKEKRGDIMSKEDIELLLKECDVKKDSKTYIDMLNTQGILIKTKDGKYKINF